MGTEEEAKDRQSRDHIGSPAFGLSNSDPGSVTGLLSERIENIRQAIEEIDDALAPEIP